MNENNKKLLKKFLSYASIFLAFFWIIIFFYGILVERQIAINLEKNMGQIYTIDITSPVEKTEKKEEVKPDLDKVLHEVNEKTSEPAADIISAPLSTQDQPADAISTNNDRAKLAIVVTNLGTNKILTEEALKLSTKITLGFSAYTTALKNQYQQAIQTGFDVLIYMPFEPKDYPLNDPGPYAMLANEMPEKNILTIKNIIDEFPGAKGIYGNYRESLSLNQKAFLPIVEFITAKNMIIFLGRNISQDSPNYLASHKNLIGGDIIIDLVPDAEAIKHSLNNLVALAKSKKTAVGYINTYPVTLSVLSNWLASFNDSEVDIVPLSAILSR